MSLSSQLLTLGMEFNYHRTDSSFGALLGDNIVNALCASEDSEFEDNEIITIAEHYTEIYQLISKLGEIKEFPIVYRDSTATTSTTIDEEIAAAEMEIHVEDEPILLEAYGPARTEIFLPDSVRCVGIQSYELIDSSTPLKLPHGRPLIKKGVPIPDFGSEESYDNIIEHYERVPGIRHRRPLVHPNKSILRVPVQNGTEQLFLG